MKGSPCYWRFPRVMLDQERLQAFADQVVQGGDHSVQGQLLLPASQPPWSSFAQVATTSDPPSSAGALVFKAETFWLP